MNSARIAALLRELADEFERDDRESAPRKRGPRAPLHPAPLGEVSELDKARAKNIMRARGIR